jgi:MerR family transcriptional regulator, redox-sensitive transcriptional activator SoxR
MLISEVAQQAGLHASAIRYYEKVGLLPPAQRASGQRRYDTTVLHRLAVIQRARQVGFTLDEIRVLFFGFRSAIRPSARWRALSKQKLAELEALMEGIRTMKQLLERILQNCQCDTLEQCGRKILKTSRPAAPAKFLRGNARSNPSTAL